MIPSLSYYFCWVFVTAKTELTCLSLSQGSATHLPLETNLSTCLLLEGDVYMLLLPELQPQSPQRAALPSVLV